MHQHSSRLLSIVRAVFLYSSLAAKLCIAAASFALLGNTALATFANGTGISIIPGSAFGWAIALQPSDGKIVVGGPCGSTYCVARLNADGSLDTSFNPGSTAGRIELSGLFYQAGRSIAKIVIRGDGKIVFGSTCTATGSIIEPQRFCVARLNSNGTLDTSFGGPNAVAGNGHFVVPISASSNDLLRGMAIESINAQKLILVGDCGFYHCVARLNDDGTFDSTFVGPGAAVSAPNDPPAPSAGRDIYLHLTGSGRGSANAVTTQSNGKIIIVGYCYDSFNRSQLCMTKLNQDGTLDVDFNGDGTPPGTNPGRILVTATTPSSQIIEEVGVDVALEPNGDFVVLCSGHPAVGSTASSHCVYRFNSGGTLDTNFSSGRPFPSLPGRTVWGTSGTAYAMAMATAPTSSAVANRIVSVGSCKNTHQVGICIGALQNKSGGPFDGVVDPTLTGTNGDAVDGFFRHAAWPNGGLFTGIGPRGVAINDSGEFFVVSTCDNQMCVYKFRTNGALDTSPCVADVNGDSHISAPSDGLALIRTMLGVPGAPVLPAGLGYDIDGNQVLDAQIDGLLFARRMMGFRDAALTAGIDFRLSALRTSATDIQGYLANRCGVTGTQ
jgi:uncharacterized delta-60 repeat protein